MKKNQISTVHSARQNSPPVSVLRTLYLIPILLLFGGCELIDPEPGLPPVTSTGEDTFGCMVNGELWLPYKDSKWFDIGAVDVQVDNGRFSVSAINERNKKSYSILIHTNENIVLDSIYEFSTDEVGYYNSSALVTTLIDCIYGGIEKDSMGVQRGHARGWYKFSAYDIPRRGEGGRKGVVAAEFEFTVFPIVFLSGEDCFTDPNSLDSIVVTQGRFDIEVP